MQPLPNPPHLLFFFFWGYWLIITALNLLRGAIVVHHSVGHCVVLKPHLCALFALQMTMKAGEAETRPEVKPFVRMQSAKKHVFQISLLFFFFKHQYCHTPGLLHV